MFARFVRPPYSVYGKFWSGSKNYINMYHVFHWLAKKKIIKKKRKKKCVTAPILKPTYDQKPETFFWPNSLFLVAGGRSGIQCRLAGAGKCGYCGVRDFCSDVSD